MLSTSLSLGSGLGWHCRLRRGGGHKVGDQSWGRPPEPQCSCAQAPSPRPRSTGTPFVWQDKGFCECAVERDLEPDPTGSRGTRAAQLSRECVGGG